ncbi:MAG: IS1182 family transposase [Chloroflexi bacterium]|nr:IS1182 family transposase [Chloroflexota bacterium]
MSLQWELSRDVPEDTATVGRMILREDNPYRQIGDRFDELLPEENVFGPMYAETGRGAISPLLLSLVTVFQMWEKVTDRYAAEMVAARIDWKYALHLPLLYRGFHFTDLYAFRVRLLEHGEERLVFEQILAKLKALGLIKQRGKMRTDSTHILAVMQRLTQLELVSECLRVALQATAQVASDWLEQALPPTFVEAYSERQREYGLSDAEVRRRLAQAGKDGYWFLAQVDQSAPKVVRQLREVVVLRTVLQQQFPSGPQEPPAKRPTGRDVIETPHEAEARRATKRDQSWIGYKVQVTESCDGDLPHLIMDLEPTDALANDSPELCHVQARLQKQGTLPGEQQVDQGYMSGENLVKSAELGIKLMGVPLADTQSPPGFRQTDFRLDEVAHQATCPSGQTNAVWSERTRRAGEPPTIQIRFEAKTCQHCVFWGRCTRSPQGRSLTLHPYRAVLQARRAEAQTEAFREQLHLRAGVEATLSELIRRHHMRHARYRGKAKLGLQAYFTATAVNLKRALRWLSQPEQVNKPCLSC